MEFPVFQLILNFSSLSVALHLAICLSVLGHQWQLTRPALPLPVFAGCPGCFFIKQSRQTLSAPFLWLSSGFPPAAADHFPWSFQIYCDAIFALYVRRVLAKLTL